MVADMDTEQMSRIVERIDQRLKALGISVSEAERRAKKRDVIRNLKRAAREGRGVTLKTVAAIAPALQTTPQWLMSGEGKADADELLELVSFEDRPALSVPSTVEFFAWAIADLLNSNLKEDEPAVTVEQATILSRAVVRIMRMPPSTFGDAAGSPLTLAEERRKLVAMAVRLFNIR
jgi:transcriptional regulator with XRE-family HTH domain